MFRQLLLVIALSFVAAVSHADDEAVVASLQLSPAGSFQAKTNKLTGVAKKNGAGYKAEKVTVDLNSLVTGMGLRDQHMKDKYLETKKFPTAELVTGTGDGGRGKGTLKMRGIEKPIEGTYEVLPGGKKLKAQFEIKLSDYGISGIRYMGVGVKDTAKIAVTIPVE